MSENNLTLTERFRPKTLSEMVGNTQAIQQVEQALASNTAFIAHGGAGTGKTTVVRAVAANFNFRVIEWNASDSRKKADLELILRQIQSKGFGNVGTIYFLDEIDQCDDFKTLAEIIKKARNPLALACNELYCVPKFVTDLCLKIRFWSPRIAEVSQVISRIEKATGLKADHTLITGDFRSSINNCFNHGTHYVTVTPFDEIETFFKKGQITQLTTDHDAWLIDNANQFFNGKTLFDMAQLLNACDQLGSFKPLKALPKGMVTGKSEYPRFIKKAAALKKEYKKK